MAIITEQDRLLKMSLEPEEEPVSEEIAVEPRMDFVAPSAPATAVKAKVPNHMMNEMLFTETKRQQGLSSPMRMFSPSKMMDLSPIKAEDKENQERLMGWL